MFSILRKGLIYEDISQNVVEHDEDIDGNEWSYHDRNVYRGQIDPRYIDSNLEVYWLYDDDINKVGLVEYDKYDPTIYAVLWFKDNPYATLFQDDRWVSKEKTLWSILSYEGYLDCLEDDFSSVFDRCLSGKYRLVTPKMLYDPPIVYSCSNCGKKSIKPLKCHEKHVKNQGYFNHDSYLFIDDSYVLYERSKELPNASSSKEQTQQQAQQQEQVPPE